MRRCPGCREWKGTLVTVGAVEPGDELTVCEEEDIVGGRGDEWPMEMAFGGGAREVNGRRVVGAGAIVWRVDEATGGMVMIARAVIGLPGEAHAQVAGAYGCKVGLRMLMDTSPSQQEVPIIKSFNCKNTVKLFRLLELKPVF